MIDKHPLRYSTLVQQIEKILFRRALEDRLDGFTLETALEIAENLVGLNTSLSTAKHSGGE